MNNVDNEARTELVGTVRRIDPLGRIVIPMELRRVLSIQECDQLEIFTTRKGEFIMRKYSPVNLTETDDCITKLEAIQSELIIAAAQAESLQGCEAIEDIIYTQIAALTNVTKKLSKTSDGA